MDAMQGQHAAEEGQPDAWGAELDAAEGKESQAAGCDVEQGAPTRESGSQSVVKVLAGQRDRFKEKTLQLEEQLRCASPPPTMLCGRRGSHASSTTRERRARRGCRGTC